MTRVQRQSPCPDIWPTTRRSTFYNWYNGIIEEVNAIEDDAEVESRKMKLNGNAARLSPWCSRC